MLSRGASGVRTEHTGSREAERVFSAWHRIACGRSDYCTDIDFLEFRFEGGQVTPRALIELKEWHVLGQKFVQSAAFYAVYELARRARVPMLFVWVKLSGCRTLCERFRVWLVFATGPNADYMRESFELTPAEMVELLGKI